VANDGGLGKVGLSASPTIAAGNAGAANTGITSVGLVSALTRGFDDAPTTVQSIAAQIQTAFAGAALVTVSNDNKLSIASTTKGANSSVILNATANSAYGALNLTSPSAVAGQNSSIADIVDNLNAQFYANGSAYQAAGLKAAATQIDGTGSGNYITIKSNNGTQFRLNAVGAPAVATAASIASTKTDASFSATTPITVTLNTNDKFNVAVNGLVAQTLQIAAGSYTTSGTFLTAVTNAIALSTDPVNGLAGRVTAGWDAATRKLTLTSVATGTTASVTTSAAGANTGLANFGFGTGSTSNGQLFSRTENIGFGVAGSTFMGTAPSSISTAMSTLDAYGISNSGAFAFQAMQYGSDKQALTFSATDSTGRLETKTITLENNASTNRAGVSIDDAVAFINQQLQQSTSNPALQQIVAVKEKVSGAEQINFVSPLSSFTVGMSATASGLGVNAGAPAQATQVTSKMNGTGANMSIDTQAGAQAAVAAISGAIAKLGTAQAAVGIGQNQLGYAINLANSQITNFSSAESQIRDTNVAQQAANLSKAQVLSQAAIAAMAQANSAPQGVLALLRG
jgi:flagellin